MESVLEKKLKKLGLESHIRNIKRKNSDIYTVVDVFEFLRKKFSFKLRNNFDTYWAKDETKGVSGQVYRILELSKIENIVDVLDGLADSGYRLNKVFCGDSSKRYIDKGDMDFVKKVVDFGFKDFLKNLKKVKHYCDKHKINYHYNHGRNILTIAGEDKSIWGAVDTLCEVNYIDFSNTMLFNDLDIVRDLANNDRSKFLKVFEFLRKKFSFKLRDNFDTFWAEDETGGIDGQVKRVLELSKIERIVEVLEDLADSGYRLNKVFCGDSSKSYVREEDVDFVKKVVDFGFKDFLKNLNGVKRYCDRHKINYHYGHGMDILVIAGEDKSIWDAVDILCGIKYIDFSGATLFNDLNIVKSLDNNNRDIFLEVFKFLEDRFGFRLHNGFDTFWAEDVTGGIDGQVERILKLSEIEDSMDILDDLAYSGYRLNKVFCGNSSNRYVCEDDVDFIEKVANVYDMYWEVLKKLKTKGVNYKLPKMKYKNNLKQFERILNIAYCGVEACEAIDILARRDRWLPFDKSEGITQPFVNEVRRIAKRLKHKKLKEYLNLGNTCFYKGKTEDFIEFFSNLKSVDEKKDVLRAILNCKYENKGVIDWIDKYESKLLREVGLE